MEDLQKRFGTSTGRYLYHICRGMDHEESEENKKSKKQMHSANEPLIVIPSKAPKSIMASKSFNPVVEDLNEMNRWFSILAIELHNRIMQNLEEYNTWPKTFSVLKGSFSACLHILISSLVTLRFNTVSFISFKSDRINYKR